MASKKDEARAFAKLCTIRGNKIAVLEMEMRFYSHWNKPDTIYKAYLDESGDYNWSPDCKTPMEAVDNRIAAKEAYDKNRSEA